MSDDYRKFDGPKDRSKLLGLTSGKTKVEQLASGHSCESLRLHDMCRYPGCEKNEKLSECSGCHSARYCSREHQLQHWYSTVLLCCTVLHFLELKPHCNVFQLLSDCQITLYPSLSVGRFTKLGVEKLDSREKAAPR